MTSIIVCNLPSGEDQQMGLKRGPNHKNNYDHLFEKMIVENATKVPLLQGFFDKFQKLNLESF